MIGKEESIKWLQNRMEEYRSTKNDIGEVVDDFDKVGKLGSGFSSIDELEEIDLGDGIVKRHTYVNANLLPEQKRDMWELLKGFVECFAWSYTEMSGLNRNLVEHRLPIK
jgi:hypothetical protein